MFRIVLSPGTEVHDGAQFYRGFIQLGDFEEEFLAAAAHWSRERYERQWRDAAKRLAAGAEVAVFITSFVHPDADAFVWAGWRDGDIVHVQNLLSLRENRDGLLDPERPEASIGPRQTVSEDGQGVSEWSVGMADISAFAA